MNKFNNFTNIVKNRPNIAVEAFDMLCGDFLGKGQYRTVYQHATNEDWVVKIENEDCQGSNWVEWRIWFDVFYTTDGTKDWFAPCHWISSNGRIMIQSKTEPLNTKPKLIPEKIPAYFTDIKADNFGWIKNNLVCHDYDYCLERFGYFALNKRMQTFKNKL